MHETFAVDCPKLATFILFAFEGEIMWVSGEITFLIRNGEFEF